MKVGFQHNFEGSKQRAYIYQVNKVQAETIEGVFQTLNSSECTL